MKATEYVKVFLKIMIHAPRSPLILLLQAHLPTIDQEKDLRPYEPIPIEYLQAFKDLWKDPGLQKAIERGNEFALHDNLS
jgi:hypothetical protein